MHTSLVAAPSERQAMGTLNRSRAEAYDWSQVVHRVRDEYVAAIAQNRAARARVGDPTVASS